jgi:hypothetical protein
MKWVTAMVVGLVLVALAVAEGEIWEEDDHEVLIRSERGTKNRGELLLKQGAHSVYTTEEHSSKTLLSNICHVFQLVNLLISASGIAVFHISYL